MSAPDRSRVIFRGEEVVRLMDGVAEQVSASSFDLSHSLVLGIANGGVALGRYLAGRLGILRGHGPLPFGVAEISFHRDDIGHRPIPGEVRPTEIPEAVEDRDILLVDDVIASGRTVRAALNEIFDQGRPRSVRLAVLLDRGGRRLPLQPDFTGIRREVPADQRVRLALDEEGGDDHRVGLVPA